MNNDLSDKSWREDFGGWWLYEEAEKSTLLETFVADGGKILNYYLLNAEDITEFAEMNYKAVIPVVVEYSVAGKTHNIIWVFCWDEAIVHIFQLDNFDSYM